MVAGLAIAASMLGTTLAAKVLERISDAQFRVWSNRIITGVSGYFVAYGVLRLRGGGIKVSAEAAMTQATNLDPLVLDFVEWIAKEPRAYADVLDAWRTSCPRLTVWEDAIDRGLVMRKPVPGESRTRVEVTAAGERFLREHQRAV